MKGTVEQHQVNWKRVVVFFIIATTISNVFRFDLFELNVKLEKLPSWIYILTTVLLEGSGVIIGALLIIPYLKKQRASEMSLFGTSTSKSLYMAAVPILLLAVIGVNNNFDINAHSYGLIASIGTLIYCVMEEYGWRGYLQEELKMLKPMTKYFIIGLIWYSWHLTFLTEASLGNNLFFLGMMIFGSWGLGQVADATKSIVACACFHLIIQIMMFNALIKNGIDGTEKLVILGVSVLIWFMIVKKWEKENTSVKRVLEE